MRSSRDVASRSADEQFLHHLIHKRNQTRTARFAAQTAALRPLPASILAPCKEIHVVVSRFSTITVATHVSSVPSRLIGTTVLVRMRAEHQEGSVGTSKVFVLPRQRGKQQHRIEYQQVVHSRVRTPGASAASRSRADLYPTTTFRLASDRLVSTGGERADRESVRILHLAATTSEAEVETALHSVLEAGNAPVCLTVNDLVKVPTRHAIPLLPTPERNVATYDQRLPSGGSVSHPRNRHQELKAILDRLKLVGLSRPFAALAWRATTEGRSHEAYVQE